MANKKVAWSGKSYGGYWGTLAFISLLKIGLVPAYGLLVFVAAFFILFRRRAVAPICAYLSKIFGCRVPTISLRAYKSVFSFGVSILDRTAYFSGCVSIKVRDCAESIIRESAQEGRGTLVLASHTGGWAIAAGKLAENFPEAAILGADRERLEIRKLVESSRRREKPKVVLDSADSMSAVAIYGILRGGGIAAMHADRNAGGRSASADFFGSRIEAPGAPYICAWHAGARVLQIFCMRESIFKYRMFCKNIDLSGCSTADEAASSGASQYFSNLEVVLRKYPYQWYNFYDFFGGEK